VNKNSWIMIPFCLLLIALFGCASGQVQPPSGTSGSACIRGTVSLRNPVDAKEVVYPGVAVSAWVHGEKKGLAETKTDGAGNFCIEVPAGDYKVDLRVWGLEHFAQENYTCDGSTENITLGSGPGRCGSGNCIRADIQAECKERFERRRW
jgi:hypothetical protein